jgi:hypothetical protein
MTMWQQDESKFRAEIESACRVKARALTGSEW